MRPPRKCLASGCTVLVHTGKSRCPAHERARVRAKGRKYRGPWAELSRAMRAKTPWCWYCGSRDDLQLDHVRAGTDASGFAVACVRCNASKGSGPAPDIRYGPGHPPMDAQP